MMKDYLHGNARRRRCLRFYYSTLMLTARNENGNKSTRTNEQLGQEKGSLKQFEEKKKQIVLCATYTGRKRSIE